MPFNNRFAALAEEVLTNVENFYSVSENGSFGRNSSSDYNHKLATWAMELSYAAYNYPNGEELPIIPGAFMGDFTKTAGMLLEDNGFMNINEYNYTSDSRAAHTIGWRPVEVAVSETSQIINDAGGMDNVYQYNIDDKGSVLYNLLDSVCVCDYDQGRNYFRDNTLITGEDTEISTSHDDEIETKPLVVVDIRGSVTVSDWINDVMTQLDSENNRFASLADEIFTNVENFYSVSENGSFGRNSSSDYNHKLATWAMELSYAAYNYPNGEELPIIPGAFMGDFTKTAGMLLEDNGFMNINEYNYTSDSRAAHTIGWRPVEVAVSETSQIINDAGGMDNVYQYNIDDKGSVLYNLLDSVCVCDYDQGRNYFRDNTLITGEDTEISTSHDDEIETKPLVVVDIRGSVTVSDWINDVMTQLDSENNRFASLADEIFTNVENFYSVSENGSFGRNSSSDYNHKLATWAMELSYAAYNYPNGEELPIIPGAFMGDFTKTAGMLLEDNGFMNINEYNYTSDSRAAHTIGWRPVEVAVSETSQIINDAGGMDNVYQYNIDDKGSVLYNLLDSVCVYERNTCRSNSGNPEIMDRNVDVLEVSENSLATTTIKNLVVIDIRGSVTLLDWGNDIVTQFAPNNNRFAALADEVLTNVESYLSSVGLQDPIILITGHSMGAAIANILAARLNETMDSGNIYAYTFATPLDRVSSCFNNIDSYGNVTAVTVSDYNHRLATWAMELSYAAYNYPNGEELPIIPGAFMGDFTKTAGMLLEDNGFMNINEYNYTSDSRAAHTIGWRPVEVAVSETSQIINDAGGMGNVYQYIIDDKGSVLYILLDSVRIYKRNSSWFDRGTDTRLDRSAFKSNKIISNSAIYYI